MTANIRHVPNDDALVAFSAWARSSHRDGPDEALVLIDPRPLLPMLPERQDGASGQPIAQHTPGPRGSYRHWTAAEERRLRANWGNYPTRLLAREMGRTICALTARAYQLGLRKDGPGRYRR